MAKPFAVLILQVGMVLLAAGSLPFGRHPAREQVPAEDYLFAEIYSVSKVGSPAGLEITPSDPDLQPRGAIRITNQSEIPVYVMPLAYKDVLVVATPDANWKNRVNLAHEAASYLSAPERPAILDIAALIDLDPSLVDHNVLSSSPPAADIAIPATQRSELLLVYGEQVMVVPFALSYAVNTSFGRGLPAGQAAPSASQSVDQASPTDSASAGTADGYSNGPNRVIIGVAAVIVLVTASSLAWLAIRRSR